MLLDKEEFADAWNPFLSWPKYIRSDDLTHNFDKNSPISLKTINFCLHIYIHDIHDNINKPRHKNKLET